MKEATGELSMTAIAVVAIAAIGAVFTLVIWPRMKTSVIQSSKCNQAFNCTLSSDGKTRNCQAYKDDGSIEDITCAVESGSGTNN